MVSPTVVVGIAGAGKSQRAMDLIEQRLKDGLKWFEIGFASFSRAACLEAAERASKVTGVGQERLKSDGYFRTIHSTALRCLGLKPTVILDSDSASGKKWYEETFGVTRGGDPGTLGNELAGILDKWDAIRSSLGRQTPLCHMPERVSHENPVFSAVDDTHDTQRKLAPVGVAPCETQGFCNENLSTLCGAPEIIAHKNQCAKCNEVLDGKCDTLVFCDCKPLIGIELETTGASLGGVSHVSQQMNTWTVEIDDISKTPAFFDIVRKYEDQKRMTSKVDFTDILLKFAGISAVLVRDTICMYTKVYADGTVPEIKLWIFDEYQDCSVLLDAVAERLSESAGEVVMLGDVYQAVYGFSGSEWRVMRAREMQAKDEGKRVLLNRSWRNRPSVIEWGESVLREDSAYEERKPWTDRVGGSVGMMEKRVFLDGLGEIGRMDSMIIARTWFALDQVKARLDQLCIPWKSCQEKHRSRWESPVKIAFVITMRDLKAGKRISEQDWRRITEELTQKWEGVELFERGIKAKWKKMECSGENVKTLDELSEWGATEFFKEFVRSDRWRRDAWLLIDTAIEKYGVDLVREPKIRIGSIHSVKGMEARNVFCMATSSEKASKGDFYEELFLKYVAITRSSLNYRVVVDLVEHARGKPMFLACPKGYWQFDNTIPEDDGETGEQDSGRNNRVGEETAGMLDLQVPGGTVLIDGSSGSAAVRAGDVRGARGEEEGRQDDGDSEGSYEEYDFGRGRL